MYVCSIMILRVTLGALDVYLAGLEHHLSCYTDEILYYSIQL
jgi:hypothetical protein